jgi:hypothetical protein
MPRHSGYVLIAAGFLKGSCPLLAGGYMQDPSDLLKLYLELEKIVDKTDDDLDRMDNIWYRLSQEELDWPNDRDEK